MHLRGFEITNEYKDKNINLPARKTKFSAGYDIEAAADSILRSKEITIVPTGLKAYMMQDEYLGIHIRSGLSIKNALSLVNGQGIIDSDYYNNIDNEGHIMIAFINHSEKNIEVKKGDRIAQGIFYKYLVADSDEQSQKQTRQGGFGSTGESS